MSYGNQYFLRIVGPYIKDSHRLLYSARAVAPIQVLVGAPRVADLQEVLREATHTYDTCIAIARRAARSP